MGDLLTPSHGVGAAPGQPPRPIPNFELLRPIGGGSYGQVWLARDVLGAYRAVKIVRRHQFPDARPYEREFEGIRRIQQISRRHPGLVEILHAGRGEDHFYYVMELADDAREESARPPAPEPENGSTTQQPCSSPPSEDQDRGSASYEPKTLHWMLGGSAPVRHALPPDHCLSIAIALTDALVHLHQAGLVHRDVKPSNVIFVRREPKLADVGLVAEADGECSFVGTEGYVAPEGPGRPAADIYALGKVLYEMLTGLRASDYPQLPDDWADSPLREERNELNLVVLRACEPDLKKRYRNAEEMRRDLELLKSSRSVARLRRLEQVTKLTLTVLAAALVALGWVLYALQRAETRAAQQLSRAKEETALRQVIQAQTAGPSSGWSSNNWSRLAELARSKASPDIVTKALTLLSGWDARRLALFDTASGFSAAFAPDGRALISGADADPALLIDTNGGHRILPVHGPGPVGWSPDGTPLHLAAVSNRLVLRDAETGAVRGEFPVPAPSGTTAGTIPVLALSADGRFAAAEAGGYLLAWRAENGSPLGRTEIAASALAFSADGSLLAAGQPTGETRVFTIPGLAEAAKLPSQGSRGPILAAAFGRNPWGVEHPAGPADRWLLATGDQGADIVIWDLARKLPRSFCRGSTWMVAALAFHPDGMTLASSGRNEARLWDLASGTPLFRFNETSSGASRALAFDARGERLVFGGERGGGRSMVGVWQLEAHRGIHVLRGLGSPIRKVWISPDSTRVAALSDSHALAVWDVTLDRLLNVFPAPAGRELADEFGGGFDAAGGQFTLAGGSEARLFEIDTGQVLKRWSLRDGVANQVQVDSAGRRLLLRSETRQAAEGRIWRVYKLGSEPSPLLLAEQSQTGWSAYGMGLAPGGTWFLVWHGEAQESGAQIVIQACAARDGRELWRHSIHSRDLELRVTFDPSGRLFGYSAAPDRRLHLLRASDFVELATTPAQDEGYYEAIAPSGKEFAGSGWCFPDLTGNQNGIRLGADHAPLSWVCAFSPNGELLAQGTQDGVVLVVRTAEVQRRVARLRH